MLVVFLRPTHLKEERVNVENGEMTKEALRQLEDEVMKDLVVKQKATDIQFVTDGEIRRKF